MEMNFCRRCGSKLGPFMNGFYTCTNGHILYPNAAPAVGVFFVTEDNQVLFSVRGIEPYKGKLDVIGGFLDGDENLEDALTREIKEETGLTPDQYEIPHYLCSVITNYPYNGEDRVVIGSLFWSRLRPEAHPIANDDVAEIVPLLLKELDTSLLANDGLRTGIKILQQLICPR